MKKVLLALSLVTALMFTACTKTGGSNSASQEPEPTERPKRNVYIEMQAQYRPNESSTTIELGQFCGDTDEKIEEVNKSLVATYDLLYQTYKGKTDEWVTLNYYPQTNRKYVNLSVLEVRFPTMFDFGRIESYAWDKTNEVFLNADDALEREGITEKRLLEKIDAYCRKNLEMGCTDISSIGFVMNEDDTVTFIVSVDAYFLSGGFGRNWYFLVKGDNIGIIDQFPFEDAQLDEYNNFVLNAQYISVVAEPVETNFPQPDMDNDMLRNNVQLAQMYSRTMRSLPELQTDNDVKYEFTSYPTSLDGESGYYMETYYTKNGKDYLLDEFFVCDKTYGCNVYLESFNAYIPCFTGFGDGEG